jgi:quinol monooxygenase YgiN
MPLRDYLKSFDMILLVAINVMAITAAAVSPAAAFQENGKVISNFTSKDLNDGFVVAINIEAKPGESDNVAAILENLISPTTAEPGVKLFLPYRSPTSPSSFFLFELYVNEAAWGTHQQTEHFKNAIKELLPRVSKRERVPFIPYVTNKS